MDVLSMSNAEIDTALKAAGPIGVWAADWIAKTEHALRTAMDQALRNGEEVQRLRQELEAFHAHPPLLVDGETGKITPLSEGYSQKYADRMRTALLRISLGPVDFPNSEAATWAANIAHETLLTVPSH